MGPDLFCRKKTGGGLCREQWRRAAENSSGGYVFLIFQDKKRGHDPFFDIELKNIRHSVVKVGPLGDALWAGKMVQKYGLQHTVRPEGRPIK